MKISRNGVRLIKLEFSALTNPVVIYASIWLTAIGLTGLHITTNLPSMNLLAICLICGNILSFFVIYFLFFLGFKKASRVKVYISQFDLTIITAVSKKLFSIWLLGTVLEVILCGGFPLIWVVAGISKNYTEFGIPTFHGLMNGLFFFITTVSFLDLCINPGKKKFLRFLPLFIWPVMMLGRGIFLGMFIQMGVAYLIVNRLNLWRSALVVISMYGLILFFGFMGDTRQTGNPFIYLVDNQYYEIFKLLPSGILWVYVYITSPIGNLIGNVENVKPSYFPHQTLGALLPSVLRDKFQAGASDNIELVDSNLNVSTFYSNFLSDYGILGAFLGVAIVQFIIVLVYFKLKEGRVWAIPAYSVLYQCTIFSVFVNLFLLQTYIIQVLLSLYCARKINQAKMKMRTSNG